MELSEHGFFIPNFPSDLCSNGWNFDDNFIPNFPLDFSTCSSSPLENEFKNYYLNEVCLPFGDEFSTLPFTDEFPAPQLTDSSYNALDTPPFGVQEDTPPVYLMEDMGGGCKVEAIQSPVFDVGICPERKIRGKKLDGQPSKNLMAERRRRKRLNDRLSMLRSIVPKISKMDRTSILGDTIDYVKELLEKINNLKQEIEVDSNDGLSILKDTKASEFIVRNSPKFEVERRSNDNTQIEICCSSKPGLLLSTVSTLEALGLEVQQCVISCFNDFALQASCSEELEQRKVQSSEDIKQALFRSAGYGGRCL